MTNIEEKTEIEKENIEHYHQRFNFIIHDLFKGHQVSLLDSNQKKIRNLINNYKKYFKDSPSYDRRLVEGAEIFGLN